MPIGSSIAGDELLAGVFHLPLLCSPGAAVVDRPLEGLDVSIGRQLDQFQALAKNRE